MIAEYLAPSIDRVLQIALMVGIMSFAIARVMRVSWNWVVFVIVLIAAVAATLYSLNYLYAIPGGEIVWRRHSYSHYFWGTAVGSAAQTNQGFEFGPLGVYFWGNILFYTSLLMFAYVSFTAVIQKLRPQK